MINVLPIRGGSCQLRLRQGPLAGVVAVLGLLMRLKRQEVGVVTGRMKDWTWREESQDLLSTMHILQGGSGEAKGDGECLDFSSKQNKFSVFTELLRNAKPSSRLSGSGQHLPVYQVHSESSSCLIPHNNPER